jgi:hypothetical protein
MHEVPPVNLCEENTSLKKTAAEHSSLFTNSSSREEEEQPPTIESIIMEDASRKRSGTMPDAVTDAYKHEANAARGLASLWNQTDNNNGNDCPHQQAAQLDLFAAAHSSSSIIVSTTTSSLNDDTAQEQPLSFLSNNSSISSSSDKG